MYGADCKLFGLHMAGPKGILQRTPGDGVAVCVPLLDGGQVEHPNPFSRRNASRCISLRRLPWAKKTLACVPNWRYNLMVRMPSQEIA